MGPRLQSETIFPRRQRVSDIRSPAGVSEGYRAPTMPRVGENHPKSGKSHQTRIAGALYPSETPAEFPVSDTRCRRGKIVSDCNRGPTGRLEVCSDSVHPALPTSGTRVGPGWSCALQWISVDGPIHYPPPQDVLSGTMFILLLLHLTRIDRFEA